MWRINICSRDRTFVACISTCVSGRCRSLHRPLRIPGKQSAGSSLPSLSGRWFHRRHFATVDFSLPIEKIGTGWLSNHAIRACVHEYSVCWRSMNGTQSGIGWNFLIRRISERRWIVFRLLAKNCFLSQLFIVIYLNNSDTSLHFFFYSNSISPVNINIISHLLLTKYRE